MGRLALSALLVVCSVTAVAAPTAPTGLAGVAFSTTRIDLTWTDKSSNETGFQVERAPNVSGSPGTFARIATTAANIKTYSDTGLAYGTRYWYRVRAVNNSGNSAYTSNVSPTTLAAASLRVSGYPTPITAGTSAQVSITALDSKGNIATGYPGTVRITSSDPQAVLPANAVLPGASASFAVTLKSAGAHSLTAQDTVTATLSGAQSAITVNAGSASLFTVTFPTSVVAGSFGTLGVTASDAFGNRATGYLGTIAFSSTSPNASLPGAYTFVAADAGAKTFSAQLKSAGTRSITAQDTAAASLSGTQGGITVTAAGASRLSYTYPGTVVAGVANNLVVSIFDAFDNPATGYRGTIAVSTTAASATLPPPYAFTAADAGTKTLSAAINSAGGRVLTVQDPSNGALLSSVMVTVNPASATRFLLEFPTAVVAGTYTTLRVTALDAYDNRDTNYVGTVAFSSTSPKASLPYPFTFPANRTGSMPFSAQLNSAGTRSLTVQDTGNAAITSTLAGIEVSPASASRFTLAYPTAVVAGESRPLSLTVLDAYDNIPAYTGTVAFTSTSTNAALPPQYTFVAGDGAAKTFTASLNSAGVRSITATDTANAALKATVANINVAPAAPATLSLRYPSSIATGAAGSVVVTASDAFGNLATSYAGPVHFTSSDPASTMPVDSQLTGGSGRFQATLRTVGMQSITAQDAAMSLATTRSGINVHDAPAPCVGGNWRNMTTQQIVPAGLGIREPTALVTYGTYFQTPVENGIVLPKCAYFSGLVRLPVFMVDWADFDPSVDKPDPNSSGGPLANYVKATPAEIDAFVNGTAGVGQYYRDVSGGQADVDLDVIGWISSDMPGSYLKPRASYITGTTTLRCDRTAVFLDAVRNAVAFLGVELTDYDKDGNAMMDGAVVLYEGQDNLCGGVNMSWTTGQSSPSTDPPGFLSQQATKLVPASDPNAIAFADQNVFVEYFNNIPERKYTGSEFRELATWVHELGHTLLGYSDSYYVKFNNIGDWTLSGGHQDIPTHPAAFEKWMFAHWLEPQALQSSGQYTLAANEIADGDNYESATYLYKIVIDGDARRFITVENRWFDSGGNTSTQWARSNGRESGLMIVEHNLGASWFDSPPNPVQMYRYSPGRATPYDGYQAFRPGDAFSKCYTTMCVTIDQIGPAGAQTQFAATITPR